MKKESLHETARPGILFKNYDYTDEGPNETSPGGGLYHGEFKFKSVKDFLDSRRKQNKKVRNRINKRKKAWLELIRQIYG